MGGLAFANVQTKSGEPIKASRMDPETYKSLSAHFQRLLETVFKRVVVPREAPAKKDHGDIDYLVDGIRSPTTKDDLYQVIQHILGADVHNQNGASSSYAVPHPEIPGTHVQVDVELSVGEGTPESAELFEWTRFMKGDSDLLQILGVTHRALGLTCNDRGLHVRVEGIEIYNKKKALIFLSRDPNAVMEFYGLDVAKYWTGFTDENDLFDWVSGGRFFSSAAFAGRVEKHNDRARQAKRPMYQHFVEKYVPAHTEKGAANTWTRQEVLEDALISFNKQAEYDALIEEHNVKIREEELWKEIKVAVPVPINKLDPVLKGLRRWVEFVDGQPCIASVPNLKEPLVWSKFVSKKNKEAVLEWVKQNWEQVKSLEKKRANAAKQAAKKA